jgi:hypothetical protein
VVDEESEFPVEPIPDADAVFMRAYKDRMKNGVPSPSAFKPQGNGNLSVDWDKYSTPDQTRNRAKQPTDNAVLRMIVANIRQLEVSVVHVPLLENQAHSEVKLPENHTEVRLKLSRIATIAIPVTV